MLRPLPPLPELEPESDDSDAFGGLANVLEPDHEDDATTSVSMRRGRASGPSGRAPAAPPVSIRAPVQVQDFAFADTVFANELPDEPDGPPSLPIFFDDARSNPQCVTPLAFPLPDAAADVDLATRRRVFFAHVRHGFRRSLEEMRELWGGTADIVYGQTAGERGPSKTSAFGFFVRRVLALWQCFQWSRADLVRAAMIGLAVFVVAGAAFASTMDLGGATSSAGGSEVRAARTLDQHTARKMVLRAKR
ncbi:MAG TPA: hypothetical protein VLT33_33210 [Labilithrix sp.]|nr:hypothetical protein [Labilithrix sp.]